MKTILTAIDGSAASDKTVDFAAELAAKCDAELILMTVARNLEAVPDVEFAAYIRDEHMQIGSTDIAQSAAETVLAGARLRAQSRGVKRISIEPTFGDPAERIIEVARDRHADLIVVGSRGHGRFAGLLLGSVSQKVVSHAPCPVTVVR
jgi:nucleotide-binding universal stress UspA family protein